MATQWHQFVMNLEANEVDQVESVLLQNGALSVTLTDAGDAPLFEPAPGETPLWKESRITALFATEIDLGHLQADLQNSLDLETLPPNHVEQLPDRIWEREWLKDFGPMQFGERLWIVPGNDPIPVDDAVVVRLDPGMAFGTGTHATTALCLEWLDRTEMTGKSVLDYGCGSGVLGIAACKLGARLVVGVDIDPQAVTASRQNAARNAVSDRFETALCLSDDVAQFDVVVANILAGTLIDHAATLCEKVKPGGRLALSGVLSEQIELVRAAYRDMIDFAPDVIRDNWALLAGTRRP